MPNKKLWRKLILSTTRMDVQIYLKLDSMYNTLPPPEEIDIFMKLMSKTTDGVNND